MKTSKQTERGSAMMAVLVTIVLVVIAGAGYWVWHRHHTAVGTSSSISSNTSSSSRSSVSLATACGNLALSKGTSEGTAGTTYTHAVITNNGSYACALTGYPAAFMTDNHSVSAGAVSNALYVPVAVTLAAHGGKAHTVLGLPDPGNFDPGTTTCTAAATSKLRLYLPGLTTYVETTFGEAACPGFSVTALQPGV